MSNSTIVENPALPCVLVIENWVFIQRQTKKSLTHLGYEVVLTSFDYFDLFFNGNTVYSIIMVGKNSQNILPPQFLGELKASMRPPTPPIIVFDTHLDLTTNERTRALKASIDKALANPA